jgi:hypothetical protein
MNGGRTEDRLAMVMRVPGDAPTFIEACGYYLDKVVRGPSGWLLADRVEHLLYIR